MQSNLFWLALLLLGGTDEPAAWTPPENPTPWKILNEAIEDARHERYPTALEKHRWYHDHAEKYGRAGGAYRLSTALYHWGKLAKKYPPALEALTDYRSLALERVERGEDVTAAFREVCEINRELGRHDLTAKWFRSFHEKDPKLAQATVQPASAALMETKEYELYGKYVDAKRERNNLVALYQNEQRNAQTDVKFKEQRLRSSENILSHFGPMLVACLMLAERENEATKLADQLRDLSQSDQFQKALEKALKGEVPPPWGTPRKPAEKKAE